MGKIAYAALIVGFISFFTYGIISKQQSNPLKKEKRLACHKKTITFEKIVDVKKLNEAIKLLESNNYKILSRIEKSKYMKSTILNYISVDKANLILNEAIKPYMKNDNKSKKKLLVDYYILENDKEDKGKKGTKCKLYAGYLVFEFKLDNSLVYKIQTDYMKIDTSDIKERMDCIIKSFVTLKQK